MTSSQFKELSRVFSGTTIQRHQFSDARLSSWFNSHIISYVSCIGRWVLHHECHLGSPLLCKDLQLLLVGRLSSSQCASFNKANSIFQMRYLSKWLVLIHTGKNIYSFYDQELTMADCMCANTGYNITFKKTNSQLTNSILVTKPEFFYY